MINTIADLLEGLRNAEQIKINELGITHPPTIGNMFEGLTGDLLGNAVFDGLNLSIVLNSFIRTDDGELSKEMDVMLIRGEGNKLLHTEQLSVRHVL